MLAATPVLWGFYFTAALLPLALRRPRLSVAWVIPFLAAFVGGYTYTCIFLGLLVWCGIGAPSLRHVLSLRARATAKSGRQLGDAEGVMQVQSIRLRTSRRAAVRPSLTIAALRAHARRAACHLVRPLDQRRDLAWDFRHDSAVGGDAGRKTHTRPRGTTCNRNEPRLAASSRVSGRPLIGVKILRCTRASDRGEPNAQRPAIPLGIVRPRLSAVWFVPLACVGLGGAGLAVTDAFGTARVVLAFAVVVGVALREERSSTAANTRRAPYARIRRLSFRTTSPHESTMRATQPQAGAHLPLRVSRSGPETSPAAARRPATAR